MKPEDIFASLSLQSEEFIVRQHELWIESRSKNGLPQKIEGEGSGLQNVIEVEPSEGEQG